jgi:hypothetical protein
MSSTSVNERIEIKRRLMRDLLTSRLIELHPELSELPRETQVQMFKQRIISMTGLPFEPVLSAEER